MARAYNNVLYPEIGETIEWNELEAISRVLQ